MQENIGYNISSDEDATIKCLYKRKIMFKKIVAGCLILSITSLFGMSIQAVNKASKEELIQIKGIGNAKADAIVSARKKHPFKSFADLEKVKGIGPVLVGNIKRDIQVKEEKNKAKKKSATSKQKHTAKKSNKK